MHGGPGGTGGTKRERVWDPLVRIFHWSLVAAFATAWFIRSEAAIHETAGMIVLGLLIFRAAWGIIGTGAARFETFVTGPVAILRYGASILRGKPTHYIGHNPAGAAMIGLMMLTLCITAASGILMTTTAFWGGSMIEWIHGASANLMLFLIAGHLAGVVAASLQHRENLPASMVHGYKQVPVYTAAYLGKMLFNWRRAALAASVVLISTGVWAGSEALLNASFWRMPKIVTAAAAKQGCAVASVDGPRVEVFPRRSLLYHVSLKTEGAPLPVEIPVEVALERKPAVTLDALGPECALRNKIVLVAAYEQMGATRLASLASKDDSSAEQEEPPAPEEPDVEAIGQPQPGAQDSPDPPPAFAERPDVQKRYKREARPEIKKSRKDRQKRKRKGRRNSAIEFENKPVSAAIVRPLRKNRAPSGSARRSAVEFEKKPVRAAVARPLKKKRAPPRSVIARGGGKSGSGSGGNGGSGSGGNSGSGSGGNSGSGSGGNSGSGSGGGGGNSGPGGGGGGNSGPGGGGNSGSGSGNSGSGGGDD